MPQKILEYLTLESRVGFCIINQVRTWISGMLSCISSVSGSPEHQVKLYNIRMESFGMPSCTVMEHKFVECMECCKMLECQFMESWRTQCSNSRTLISCAMLSYHFWSSMLYTGDFSMRVLEGFGFCWTGSSSISVSIEVENTPHLIKQVQQRIKHKDCIHVWKCESPQFCACACECLLACAC